MNDSQDVDPSMPPEPADEQPVDTSGVASEPGAVRSKRRRRSPREGSEAASAAVEPGPSEAAPVEQDSLGVERSGREGADASGPSTDGAVAGDQANTAAPTDGEPRRSRRNRRRGRKGRGGRDTDVTVLDIGVGVAGAGEVGAMPPTIAMPDAGELFATVTSGAFDVDAGAELVEPPSPIAPPAMATDVVAGDGSVPVIAQAPAEEPADTGTSRRVLAPDVEAPKLQKVLAQAGVGSRRDLEQMIIDKRVTVNGEPAHIGQRVSWGDRVAVDGKPVRVRIAPMPARVIAYHKPAGEVVTHDDPQQRPTVFRRLPRLPHGKWQSVGRLDINTEGLLLFTTSGELANQLMHPRFGVEREYAVRVLGTLDNESRARLLEGVQIEGQNAAFKSIDDGGGEGANHWYRVVITEGRNREVRKLFDAVGLTVNRLIRIRYGSVVLPRGLKRGVWVDLAEDDVKLLRRLTGLDNGRRDGDSKRGRGGRVDAAERAPERQVGPRPPPRADDGPRRERQPPPERSARGPQRGRGQPRLHDSFGDAAVHAHDFDEGDHVEVVDVANIPNPLQQTFDQRAIREARASRRELGDDAPIPNPLQQTYDKRAIKEIREPRRESEDDDGPIPNPLQQTYDKRFAHGGPGGQRPRGGAGGRGKSAGAKPAGGQPDPMKTAVGYIGGDAFLRKKGGGRGGKGGSGAGSGGRRTGGGGGRGGKGR